MSNTRCARSTQLYFTCKGPDNVLMVAAQPTGKVSMNEKGACTALLEVYFGKAPISVPAKEVRRAGLRLQPRPRIAGLLVASRNQDETPPFILLLECTDRLLNHFLPYRARARFALAGRRGWFRSSHVCLARHRLRPGCSCEYRRQRLLNDVGFWQRGRASCSRLHGVIFSFFLTGAGAYDVVHGTDQGVERARVSSEAPRWSGLCIALHARVVMS